MNVLPAEVAAKVLEGHVMEWDPPAALTAAQRWTCINNGCGATVIRYGERVYGSATEKTCEQSKADWAEFWASRGGA